MRAFRILLVLLLLTISALADDKSLLVNGGFEKGMRGWFFANNSKNATTAFDQKVEVEGRQALRIEKEGGGMVDAAGCNFDVEDGLWGGTFTVSAKVRGKKLGNSWVSFLMYDTDGNNVVDEASLHDKALAGSYDWKEVKKKFDIPKNVVSGRVLVQLFEDGTLWVDDVKVVWSAKGAVDPASRKPLAARTKKWLDGNALPVANIDIDGPLDDLMPLKGLIGDARIVQLGENTHGDGAAFAAKCRLIRFLHEEMGFTVLAWESGLYECDRANVLLAAGNGADETMKAAIFRIWHTARTKPVFSYMARRAKEGRPLRLAGTDCQRTGELGRGFVSAVLRFLDEARCDAGPARKPMEDLAAKLGEDEYVADPATREAGLDAMRVIATMLEKVARPLLIAKHGERETEFFTQCWRSFQVQEALKFGSASGKPQDGLLNIRDEQMAKNLIWLAEKRYPGEKIVCWAATAHQAHGLKGVKINGKDTYRKLTMMGEHVHQHFKEACYTIGFVAHHGRAGRWFSPKFDLPAPLEGSIEDQLFRYGKPLLFVNLRGRSPFDKRLRCAPMTYIRNITAKWPKVLDGLFYIEKMEPARTMDY